MANRLKTRYPGKRQRRDVLRGDGCRRGFSGTAVDKHLPAAETRVHHTPPDAPANTLPHQLFDDGALRVREHIRRPVENSEPEREALGIGQSVVPELNLGSVLVKRPVVLNALAVGDDDLLGDLIPGLGDERLVVRQQPAHQVVPGQPYLVLPGAAEARTLDDPQPLLQFRTGKFAADHQQNRGEFLGNPDLPVPPVQRRRFLRIPVGKPLVQQAADTPVAMPRRRRVGIKFRQGVHPRQVQRRLPPPPRPVVVVDVGPESARIEKPEQAPHLAVRKVDRRVELEQQHVVRPPVIGITDETFGRLPVRGIGHHRHIDKGLPHTVERTGRAGAGRRQKKQGGQKGRT